MNDFKIFNIDLANHLMEKGYRMLKIKPNTKSFGFLMFFFEFDNTIEQAISEYKKTKK
ncbi:DUF5659 domain-containing protein [Peribacillus frigoritolerans]|uniref:DUF5659 domain-containing protein n=1 Tax=Peribacillus frigoritolerans TaxID=450367 RepID=UPI00216205DB|nr:DUF5659 domain-containing protein [Peribacillus frigoritolerans]